MMGIPDAESRAENGGAQAAGDVEMKDAGALEGAEQGQKPAAAATTTNGDAAGKKEGEGAGKKKKKKGGKK